MAEYAHNLRKEFMRAFNKNIAVGVYLASLKKKIVVILRWSEKYTKTDMVYLAGGGAWLGFSQLISSIGALVLTLVLANMLSPEIYGEYRFLMSGFLMLIVFALPGMQTALLESTPKGFKKNIATAFREMMRFGFIGSAVSLLVALYYFTQDNISLSLGFAVIALALPFFNSSSAYLFYLKALKEFKKVTIYTALTRVVLLIVSIIAALLYPQHAWLILVAFLFGQIIPSFIFHRKTVATHVREEDTADPGINSYAKHLTAMAALGLIAVQLDKMLVWHFIGAEELAIFFIAYAIPQETMRLLRVIPTLAFPKFAATDPETIRRTLMPKTWKFFFVIGGGVAIYILLAPYLFQLLFPQYMESVIYSQVLMLTVLVAAFAPISIYFTTIKAKKVLYFLTTVIPAVRILAAVLFIALFGMWGAIFALLIESVLRASLLLFLFTR
jgi:O-antigen/teichoic acid export membrane protein